MRLVWITVWSNQQTRAPESGVGVAPDDERRERRAVVRLVVSRRLRQSPIGCEVTETVSLSLDPQKRQWISDRPESSCCTTSLGAAVGSSPVESWIPQRAGRRILDVHLNCLSIYSLARSVKG